MQNINICKLRNFRLHNEDLKYHPVQMMIQEKISGGKGPWRSRISWFRNLRQFGKLSVQMFRATVTNESQNNRQQPLGGYGTKRRIRQIYRICCLLYKFSVSFLTTKQIIYAFKNLNIVGNVFQFIVEVY